MDFWSVLPWFRWIFFFLGRVLKTSRGFLSDSRSEQRRIKTFQAAVRAWFNPNTLGVKGFKNNPRAGFQLPPRALATPLLFFCPSTTPTDCSGPRILRKKGNLGRPGCWISAGILWPLQMREFGLLATPGAARISI